jgi:hypothetical protein
MANINTQETDYSVKRNFRKLFLLLSKAIKRERRKKSGGIIIEVEKTKGTIYIVLSKIVERLKYYKSRLFIHQFSQIVPK